MPDSCFGCCSIRSSISFIYVFNILWITLIIICNFLIRQSDFYLMDNKPSLVNTTSHTLSAEYELNDFLQLDYNYKAIAQSDVPTPILSAIFMDYVFFVQLGWCVMEFYLNICLQRSKYEVSPEKVYAWLVIYCVNLGGLIIFIILGILKCWTSASFRTYYNMNFIEIIIIGLEIYIVRKYYEEQKLAAVGNLVHIKWNYLPKPKIQSDKLTSTIIITTDKYNKTQDESNYIPVFVKELRNTNP